MWNIISYKVMDRFGEIIKQNFLMLWLDFLFDVLPPEEPSSLITWSTYILSEKGSEDLYEGTWNIKTVDNLKEFYCLFEPWEARHPKCLVFKTILLHFGIKIAKYWKMFSKYCLLFFVATYVQCSQQYIENTIFMVKAFKKAFMKSPVECFMTLLLVLLCWSTNFLLLSRSSHTTVFIKTNLVSRSYWDFIHSVHNFSSTIYSNFCLCWLANWP